MGRRGWGGILYVSNFASVKHIVCRVNLALIRTFRGFPLSWLVWLRVYTWLLWTSHLFISHSTFLHHVVDTVAEVLQPTLSVAVRSPQTPLASLLVGRLKGLLLELDGPHAWNLRRFLYTWLLGLPCIRCVIDSWLMALPVKSRVTYSRGLVFLLVWNIWQSTCHRFFESITLLGWYFFLFYNMIINLKILSFPCVSSILSKLFLEAVNLLAGMLFISNNRASL